MHFPKLKVAILGSGNIGTDLLVKLQRSQHLTCSMFIGRNPNSSGLKKAESMGIPTSSEGINAIINNPDSCDIVFDATSAIDHIKHAPILQDLDKFVVDLTPSKVGEKCIPAVNLHQCINKMNVNMVTCGGQASIPIAYAISECHKEVDYIEVVSSISSKSAGPATRSNLDEYIESTESAILQFTNSFRAKAILNLNPAVPCIDMQTTIFAVVKEPNLDELIPKVNNMVKHIQNYVPGYQLVVSPTIENGRIVVMVKVQGAGDFLPKYAGNLDIINCAAITISEEYAKNKLKNEALSYE